MSNKIIVVCKNSSYLQSKINNYSDSDDEHNHYEDKTYGDLPMNNEDIDYYPELKQYKQLINENPDYEYGIIHNKNFHLFRTHHDLFNFRIYKNITINDYKLYVMDDVRNNTNPKPYI